MNTFGIQSTPVDQYGVFSAGQTGAGQSASGEGTDFDSLLEPEAGQSSNVEKSGSSSNAIRNSVNAIHNAPGKNKFFPYIVDRMSRPKTPPHIRPMSPPKGISKEENDKFLAATHQIAIEFYTKCPRSMNTIPEWYTDLVRPGVPIEEVEDYHTQLGGQGQLPVRHPVGEMGDMYYEYETLLGQAMDQALNQNGIAEDDWAAYERAVTNADISERIRRDILAILAANSRAVELMDTLKITA
jgi:hypothetical protein